MKLFKNLITSTLILSAVIISPYSVLATETLGDVSITLQKPKLTDTFLVENIKGTHVTNGFSEYRITSSNTIEAKGKYLAGTKTHTAVDHWETVLKDSTGTPLDNVVKISTDYTTGKYLSSLSVLIALTSDGEVYVATDASNYMIKLTELKDIVDISVESGDTSYTDSTYSWFGYYCITSVDTSGKLTRTYFGGSNKTNAGTTPSSVSIISDKVYEKVYKANRAGTVRDLRLPTYVMDNQSNLYKVQGNQKFEYFGVAAYKGISVGSKIATNVKDVSYNGALYTLTNRGELFYSESLSAITYTKNGERVTPMVHSILSASGSSANSCFVYTDMGPALVQGNKGYILDFGFTPVDVWYESNGQGYAMDDQGDIYSFVISTEITTDSFVKESEEDWANHNPVIPTWKSVEFNIDFNQIIERNNYFEVVFKVISNKTPTAFNVYYAKSNEVTDSSLWKPIQKNVSSKVLNPVVEATEYKDKNGQPINRITYTYNWKLTNGDMSNIHLIIDPIYA